jgi:hypothetical protein
MTPKIKKPGLTNIFSTDRITELISGSFKHLQKAFEERRKEFRILPPVEDISPDTIEQTAFQLMAIFLPEPE